MKIENIKVAWSMRRIPNPPETTDINGYYPYIFSFTDGSTVTEWVRNDNQAGSFYQPNLFQKPSLVIDVQLWHTRDRERVYVTTNINPRHEPVTVPIQKKGN